jgi:hypothetical protein
LKKVPFHSGKPTTELDNSLLMRCHKHKPFGIKNTKGVDGMELERQTLRGSTVEGYRILLRAQAELLLPLEYPVIREFYITLARRCIEWTCEVTGERLRARYLALDTNAERAHFDTRTYRFAMRYCDTDDRHAAIVCESRFSGDGERIAYRRISHVWYLAEQTLLPPSQIIKRYSQGRRVSVGFPPDGIYPENGDLVLFKNATEKTDFTEKRISLSDPP